MDYLNDRPELVKRLSRAAGRRRSYQCASRNYRVAAVAVTLLGAASFVYGAVSLVYGGALAAHFLLFGLIALLLTVRSAVRQPRRKHSAVARADAQAKAQMQAYLDRYPDFPLPACYAHPIVLRRMQRVIADGRAEDAAQALQTVKADLKAMNAEVRVSQEEYDEIAVIKPLFLNESYR